MRSCEVCGLSFETTDRRKKYCSQNCGVKASQRRKREKGLCVRCGAEAKTNPKTGERYYFCEEHRSRTNEERLCKQCGKKFLCRERRQVYCCGACRHNAFNERRRKGGICRDCGERTSINSRTGRRYYYCDAHRTRKNETDLNRYYRSKSDYKRREAAARIELKSKFINVYGKRCACCGDTREMFLTLDHVRGDGSTHRKKASMWSIYKHAVQSRDNSLYQVLCMNCNFLKGNEDSCPCGTVVKSVGRSIDSNSVADR